VGASVLVFLVLRFIGSVKEHSPSSNPFQDLPTAAKLSEMAGTVCLYDVGIWLLPLTLAAFLFLVPTLGPTRSKASQLKFVHYFLVRTLGSSYDLPASLLLRTVRNLWGNNRGKWSAVRYFLLKAFATFLRELNLDLAKFGRALHHLFLALLGSAYFVWYSSYVLLVMPASFGGFIYTDVTVRLKGNSRIFHLILIDSDTEWFVFQDKHFNVFENNETVKIRVPRERVAAILVGNNGSKISDQFEAVSP